LEEALSTNSAVGPLGATVVRGGVRFGIWAPKAQQIDLVLERAGMTSEQRLERDGRGIHVGFVAGAKAGDRYRFRVNGGDAFPDPRSRFQPEGVHGPSEVVDPAGFAWTDGEWPGIAIERQVIYELHVGAYTPEGTFAALARELPAIARLGVSAVELMPVADFPGRWNWGYDGVSWFAPSRAYGRPDDLRALVDAAHGLGLAVILDVVYNHFGPDGNYVRVYSDDYFTPRHHTPWGDAINYDGANSEQVRAFVLDNVRHWIAEYHLDGLRLDATDTILDDGPLHILTAIQETARAATERSVVVIAEESRNTVRTIQPVASGGYGIDAVWADDFHHAIRVYLTNARENYYANYQGELAEAARAINEGFVYQGQTRPTSGEPRGTKVTTEPGSAFVFCIQNHDQVGNRPFGERLHHDIEAGKYAVASALLLLAPETPLLFMGQELAASTPFLFFTDHHDELGRLVTEGRRKEFSGFRAFDDEAARAAIPDPQAESTFLASKLRLGEREHNAGIVALYRDLLTLRRNDAVLASGDRRATRAAPIGVHAIALHRRRGDDHRVLIANFGAELTVDTDAVEHLAGLRDREWTPLLSTADAIYGGSGDAPLVERTSAGPRLVVPARAAVLFALSGAS
jgi:maltooligosyltrehalose trehalohydrolase